MVFKQLIGRGLGTAALAIKAHAPEILLGVGAVSFVATVVSACKATPKCAQIFEEHNRLLEANKKCEEGVGDGSVKVYKSKKEAVPDRIAIYLKTGWRLVKNYKWTIIFGGISLGCFLSGNIILRRILNGTAAALAAVTIENDRNKEYIAAMEDAINEKLGSEKLEEIRDAACTKTGGTVVTNIDEKGNVTKHRETGKYGMSEFAKIYDSSNPNWEKDPVSNRIFLEQKERWMNDRLQTWGHLFLNDVYEALDMPKTQAGQVMGWKYYDSEEERIANGGSNYVSFGIFDTKNKAVSTALRRFLDGLEPNVWLDFNCDETPILGRVGLASA